MDRFMRRIETDAFVTSADKCTLTPERVTQVVASRRISINGKHSCYGWTALQYAVYRKRPEVVVALLAAGACANVKIGDGLASVYADSCPIQHGITSVWLAAFSSNANTLQVLIESGGNVNEPAPDGQTPLLALVRNSYGDAASRLAVLLARPELDLDNKWKGKTAKRWAADEGYHDLAAAIEQERTIRKRWSPLRSAWVAAIIAPIAIPSTTEC
jgi:ankyrin repeat protein